MKLSVVALDYDGTIAEHDTLDPGVRSAIAAMRNQGVLAILVTGRILGDLRRVAGDLRFVDAIVAENGGVLAFPHEGRSLALGPPPSEAFLAELVERGIHADAGQCVVEAAAADAPAMLDVLRRLQLPLTLVFNGERVMALPPAVDKASGLHAALRMLRLSEHNAIGIGDAENDHALLSSCELGVAVDWGSPALKAAADQVIPGAGPAAVAGYLRHIGNELRLAPESIGRRRIELGHAPDGRTVSLAVRGRNLLVVGDSQTGKSWVAGLVCEQLVLQRYSLCVIDPEGDYQALDGLPGMIILGGGSKPPRKREVTLALRHPDLSAVIDLSQVACDERCDYVAELLPQLAALRRRTGLPHRIVIDEAHQFLAGPEACGMLDQELEGYTLITYRPELLDPGVRAMMGPTIATRLTTPDTIFALEGVVSAAEPDGWRDALGSLALGEALLIGGQDPGPASWCRIRLAPRLTPHVRHRVKYLDVPVPSSKAFVFTDAGTPIGQQAATLRELVRAIETVTGPVLAGHLQRGDLSRWVGDVYADQELARDLRKWEQLAPYEALSDIRAGLTRLIQGRYACGEELFPGVRAPGGRYSPPGLPAWDATVAETSLGRMKR